MFPFYTLAYAGAALLACPYYLVRGMKTGRGLDGLSARLGLIRPDLAPKSGPRAWIHALSLGETVSALELLDRLSREGYDVCLSTTTRSASELVRQRLGPSTGRLPFPLDWPPAIRRLIRAARPDLFVLVETDIWPNVLAELSRCGVPAVLVNARVSPRSLAGYRMVRPLWRRVLGLLHLIGCQTDLDRQRLLSLGARPESVTVTGNLKYDRPLPETGPKVRAGLLAETGLPDGLWLVGGSTHPGEDEVLLDLFEYLRPGHPSLRLLLAPRNRRRFEPVWDLIKSRGLPAGRRSQAGAYPEIQVFLLDSQGELDRFFELADVVFVGKSLPVPGEGGGHNLLEPAARSKPVLFGPRMHNFPEIAELMIRSGGGGQVSDAAGLKAAVAALLKDQAGRKAMGDKAREAARANQGALARTMDLIRRTRPARKNAA